MGISHWRDHSANILLLKSGNKGKLIDGRGEGGVSDIWEYFNALADPVSVMNTQ